MSVCIHLENNISTHAKRLQECKEKGNATCIVQWSPIPELAGPMLLNFFHQGKTELSAPPDLDTPPYVLTLHTISI